MRKVIVIMLLVVVVTGFSKGSFAAELNNNAKQEEKTSGKKNLEGYQNTLAEMKRVFNGLRAAEDYFRDYGMTGMNGDRNSSFTQRVLANMNQYFSVHNPGSNVDLISGRGTFVMNAEEKIYLSNFKAVEYFLDERTGWTMHFRRNSSGNGVLYTVTCADIKGNYLTFQINSADPYNAEFIEVNLPISAEISSLGLGNKGTKFSIKELYRLLNVYYGEGMGNTRGELMTIFAGKLLMKPQYRYSFIEQSLDMLEKERGQ